MEDNGMMIHACYSCGHCGGYGCSRCGKAEVSMYGYRITNALDNSNAVSVDGFYEESTAKAECERELITQAMAGTPALTAVVTSGGSVTLTMTRNGTWSECG